MERSSGGLEPYAAATNRDGAAPVTELRYLLMNCTDIDTLPEYERVYVHGATATILAQLLDATVPWVWILGHRPNRNVQWWKATLPLNTQGSTFTGLVRDLCVDIQMPTAEFVSRAKEFDDHGLVLIQSFQQMPDTLCLERIPESEHRKVLVRNGATMRLYLPHAIETALVESFSKGYLARLIGK